MPNCEDCAHRTPTALFILCAHTSSKYRVAERNEQHTTSHMRKQACGAAGHLFTPKGAAIEPARDPIPLRK